MRTVIVVPRRAHPERDKLWTWARARWERHFPEFAIYEGHHDEGPFNRSAAVNRAARLADVDGRWDQAIVIDADIFVRRSQVLSAVATASKTGHVTWAHRRWRGLHQDWTTRILADRRDFGADVDREDMDILVERTNPISWSCCIVFPRAVWDDLGGFDERFVGWGFEDMAIQSIVVGMYGHERIEGDVYHLWHDRSTPGDGRAAKARGLYTPAAITNARLGRRYMVALRRDHGLHDRPGLPASEEERQRDIGNLKRDDDALAADAARLKLPDWSDWWPTLEELRDQARDYNAAQQHGTVTVVVTSGGTEETWRERSGYLRQSLASLSAHVSGPIVQRVIYSDWPEELAGEVASIAGEYGFYVVGGQHVGYTEMRQRLWRYLAKRAQGSYIFATEDDFQFTRQVDLQPLLDTLAAQPHLVQMALLRDACYEDERQTGGILGWPEPAFTWRESWVEHRLFFTANSSLFRRSLTEVPWPDADTSRRINHRRPDQDPSSETAFGKILLRNNQVSFAFWDDVSEPWIKHLGITRAGSGY